MRKVLFTATVLLLAVAVANPTPAVSREARFIPTGEEPLAQFPSSRALGISSDGERVLVCLGFIGCGVALWYEGNAGQFDTEYTIVEGISGGGFGITDNYEVLMTPGSVGGAAIYSGVGEFPNAEYSTVIPNAAGYAPCGGSVQSAYAISGDGQHVTGLTWIDENGDGSGCEGAQAFQWDRASNTTTALDNSVNNDSTRGNAINADGSVIVGWGQTNQREAMKWVNGVQSFICPDPIGQGGENFCNEGWAVSDDGQTILTSHAGPGEFSTFAAIVDPAGNITKMDPPPFPGDPSFDTWNARGMRGDGGAVVGSYGGSGFFGSPPYPVLWQPDLGTIDLHVMLLGQGIDDLFFWFLSDSFAISDDGKRIVGYGTNPNGWVEGFMVDITKVKVCHKPDNQHRTLTISWDSVADHLAHGDELATCEFVESDGRSRAAEQLLRGHGIAADVSADPRLGMQQQKGQAPGTNSYFGALPIWNVDGPAPELPRMPAVERLQRARQLADRVRDY